MAKRVGRGPRRARRLPERADGSAWPKITIVTPSYNQGQFIEETIRSIILQGYPNLEYLVLDGGSTDQTVEIVRKYEPWIDFWVSEADGGQSAAINRGLRMGTGSHAAWINSDDLLCQHALTDHLLKHQLQPDLVHIGDCVNLDAAGNARYTHRGAVHSLLDLVRVEAVWRSGGYICQQEVLFPLPLAMSVGGLDEDDHYAMDYELWGRLFLGGARVEYTGIPFGMFRWHDAMKTKHALKQTESMLDAAVKLIERAPSIPPAQKQELLADLDAYRRAYPDILWRQSGRLPRLGLPPAIVNAIRHLRKIATSHTSR